MPDIQDLLRHAREAQGNIKKATEELARIAVTGDGGAGMVKITMTCNHKITHIEIDPSLLDPQQPQMLRDLLATAFNDAARKVEKKTREKMSGLAGVSIPGLPL